MTVELDYHNKSIIKVYQKYNDRVKMIHNGRYKGPLSIATMGVLDVYYDILNEKVDKIFIEEVGGAMAVRDIEEQIGKDIVEKAENNKETDMRVKVLNYFLKED